MDTSEILRPFVKDMRHLTSQLNNIASDMIRDKALAKKLDEQSQTQTGSVMGTPSYMAPEMLRGEEATSRADLFSFATVAYEVLTNHKPFEGDSVSAVLYKVAHEPVLAPRLWRAELPEAYDGVFGRALAKVPERRFPSAREGVPAAVSQLART